MRFHRPRNWRAAILAWACLWALPAKAGQLFTGLGTSLAYETNIARIETNPQPDWIQSLYGGVYYTEDTESFKARTIAQLEHRHFYRGTFSDDTTGYLDGVAVWTLSPRRLTWGLDDTFREVQTNLTAPDTPSNRTESNTLSTGPDLTFAVSSANTMLLGGRYGRFDIKNSPNDNHRYMGYARALHKTSPVSTLSLNYEASKVFFDPQAQLYPEVLIQDLYARFQTENAGDSATIDAGVTRVLRYTVEPIQGHIVRVLYTRAFSREARVRLVYADQVSDTYSDQIRGITQLTGPTDTGVIIAQGINFAAGDLYRSQRGELSYSNQVGASSYTLMGFGRYVNFFTLDEDYVDKGVRFAVNWLPGSTRVHVFGDYGRRNFLSLDRQDTLRNVGVIADFRLNRSFMLSMSGNSARQQSTAPGNSYQDQRVMVAVSYSTGAYEVHSRR